MNERNKLVVVAMSGGVDSSVTAAILLEQGYQVLGMTMEIGAGHLHQAARDAGKVARALGVKHHVISLDQIFRQKVIQYFCRQYLAGQTPNPCVVCNREIKFGALMSRARELGADYLATGHYARIEFNPQTNRYALRKAQDTRKDQTYFLYTLRQPQLAYTLFPLGDLTKDEVRQRAMDFNLPVAEKKESQEICFVPDNDYRSFVRQNVTDEIEPGPFLDLEGRQVGEHQGLPYYTIGQRRGLGIALGEKVYVVGIDPRRNAVILGPESALCKKSLTASHINLTGLDQTDQISQIRQPVTVDAQIRYNGTPARATVTPRGAGGLRVDFDVCQRAVTPGQAVVFYRGEYVWGGGTIVTDEV